MMRHVPQRFFVRFVKMLEERDIFDVDKMNRQGAVSPDTIRKLATYQCYCFARNENRKDQSVQAGKPVPFKVLSQKTKGSQKCAGKIQGRPSGGKCLRGRRALSGTSSQAPDQEIARLVNFYDYLESSLLGTMRLCLRMKNMI